MAQDIKQLLNERDGWQVWWRLLRPHTLTASFIPVFVGTMFAYITEDILQVGLFLAMLLASILIQAATNMFNEYYDYVRGLDNEKSVGDRKSTHLNSSHVSRSYAVLCSTKNKIK